MTSMGSPALTIRLHPRDNIVVATSPLAPGEVIATERVFIREPIPARHKVATAKIPRGAAVYKYGCPIGVASRPISPGEHVHSHNLSVGKLSQEYQFATEADSRSEKDPVAASSTFKGIVRANGQVATRNYVGIVATVACAAAVGRLLRDRVQADLARYPQVDGVVALAPASGCGMPRSGPGYEYLQRTLAGFIRHPNFAGVLVLGLGCEVNLVEYLLANHGLQPGRSLQTLVIQETGGTEASITRGMELGRSMLAAADRAKRQPVSAANLIVGLECGGSDAYSGISANPALGAAVDLLVRQGGTAILSETPEIYGAEHLLTRRAATPEVGKRLLERIRWWEQYTTIHQASIDNNPSPGNKAAGLTTIFEKSLGAVAKAGSTALQAVYGYAEPVNQKGLVFMDTPGYDPVSVTGMIAGGANLICFTTGCGTVVGATPAPVLKLATNSELYRRMRPDMDVNCGEIIDGYSTVAAMGEKIFQRILDVASGNPTASESYGFGECEFVPWQIGAVL